jgi:hypothetical protein
LLAIEINVEAALVPIGKGIINSKKSRDFWGRRVCECVLCVAPMNRKVESSGESNEETKDRLFNAGSVSFSESVKLRSSAL